MKFGSVRQRPGQARRSRPRQRPGVSGIRRLHRRGRGARLHQHLRGRAPFHRLRSGLGDAQPADLGRGAHHDAAARHRRDRAALAQPGAAGRAGGDHRSAVGRPARFRRRQGLPPRRVRELLHSDGGGRRALRGRPRRDPEGLDLGRALLASRQVLELRGHHRRAADGAEAASADLDGGGQPGFDPQGRAARLQAAARPARLDRADDRTVQHLQDRGRRRPAGGSIRWMSACRRAFFVARNAEEKAKAVETRFANQQRLAKAGDRAGRKEQGQPAVVRPDARRGGRKRDVRHAGRDRREARACCARPASSMCCSTARPARARTCAPSPATSCRRSPGRAAAASREQPALAGAPANRVSFRGAATAAGSRPSEQAARGYSIPDASAASSSEAALRADFAWWRTACSRETASVYFLIW